MNGAAKYVTATPEEVGAEDFHRIEQFIFYEARLADESRYAEWEALWDSEGIYWIPVGNGDYSADEEVSIVHDNRARLASRIKQLQTGKRYAQVPVSVMRRIISNLEVVRTAPSEFHAHANFLLLELAIQSNREQRLWGGRVEYKIRMREGEFKIFLKKIMLTNASEPIPNLPFLI